MYIEFYTPRHEDLFHHDFPFSKQWKISGLQVHQPFILLFLGVCETSDHVRPVIQVFDSSLNSDALNQISMIRLGGGGFVQVLGC